MMNKFRRANSLLFGFVMLGLVLTTIQVDGFQARSIDKTTLENDKIRVELDKDNGAFIGLTELESHQVMASSRHPGSDSPWEIHYLNTGDGENYVDISHAGHFSFHKPDPH